VKTVLVVDDEPGQRQVLETVLARHGYRALAANSGGGAVQLACEQPPDIVLLDVVMPELDGWQTCRILRQITDAPIIMMTGQRHGEADIVRGLDCGADDYLLKPVGHYELLARIRAVLRRAEPSGVAVARNTVYDDGYLAVDLDARRVDVAGRRVRLTPREFRLLSVLLQNADRVLSHRQMLEAVWGFEYLDAVDYVRIYVSHVRQKIEPAPSRPRYVITEPGIGYRFAGQRA
jgi:two-component system KDP operon response regulator KdpE